MTFFYLSAKRKAAVCLSLLLFFLFFSNTHAQILVKDINASGNASPDMVVEMGGIVYFEANDGSSGLELWKSDGTEAGTVLVKDINPGAVGGAIDEISVVNGKLLFEANDGTNGNELWVSDGTTAGTMMLKDIRAGSGSSSPRDFFVLNNTTLFFAAYTDANGTELWKSDGTAIGTVLVKDINTGSSNSTPKEFGTFNNEVYFQANDGSNGAELWKSDGTAGGTTLVLDIRSGLSSSSPKYMMEANGMLFFQANDGTNGAELWVSDGTGAGTNMVSDIFAGGTGSMPINFHEYNSQLFFTAFDPSKGFELMVSDGTGAGTSILKDIWAGFNSSSPGNFITWNGTLYFSAAKAGNGNEVWKSDGTEVGTELVKDIRAGSDNSDPTSFIPYKSKLFFIADDGVNGAEVWLTDGTEAGTKLAMDIQDGLPGSVVGNLTLASNMLFFGADDGSTGAELRLIGNCDVSVAPILKEAGTHESLFEKTDGGGWTHYCDCANNILLSLEIGSTGAVVPEDAGVSVKIDATAATYHAQGCVTTDCFITNSDGGVIFNRSWDVAPTTQPSSDIPVRFYFDNGEYTAVNTEMTNQALVPLTDPSEMSFFKVTNGALGQHPLVENIKTGDAIVLPHDPGSPATPSTTTWVLGAYGSDHYAEFLVASFSGGGGGAGSAGSALPVELVYFGARPTPDNNIVLEWSTASEIDNYGWIIEKSYDFDQWMVIGFVESDGGVSSPSDYRFLDEDAQSGDNYYRLRQRDFDGTETLSEIAHVMLNEVMIVDIYPNPVSLTDELVVDIDGIVGEVDISIFDVSRSLVFHNNYYLNRGNEPLSLDMNILTSGMYVVRISSKGIIRNYKIVVQE